MSTASQFKLPGVRVLAIGQAKQNAAGFYVIELDDSEAEPLTTGTMTVPVIFGTNEAIVCEEALMTIKPPQSLEELVPLFSDKLFVSRVLSLVSMFPSVEEMAITVSDFDGFVAMRGGNIKGTLLAHWINETDVVGICGGFENITADNAPGADPRNVYASDLMYALGIISTYKAIGSTEFLLRRDWHVPDPALGDHRGYFIVGHNDAEYPGAIFGSRFPIGGKV